MAGLLDSKVAIITKRQEWPGARPLYEAFAKKEAPASSSMTWAKQRRPFGGRRWSARSSGQRQGPVANGDDVFHRAGRREEHAS
jgi:hypothetical protein